jgi:isopenicillin N synthase-like dioxygenase
MAWRYSPQYDPDPKDLNTIPEEVKPWLRGEEFVWEGTSHLPGFKDEVLAYWAASLTLARRLVKAFALSLDLPEDYFDSRVTYPGADGVFNYYPPRTEEETAKNDVGLGSHTDLQLFTLLWQDMVRILSLLISSCSPFGCRDLPVHAYVDQITCTSDELGSLSRP